MAESGMFKRREIIKGGSGMFCSLLYIGTGVVSASGTGTDETADGEDKSNTESPGDLYSQAAKLVAEDGDDFDKFGFSAALSEDGETALIGAVSDEDPNGTRAGAAYVFERSDGRWSQQAKLSPDDGVPGILFGYSVALTDGTALVGAVSDNTDSTGQSTGSAYVFERSDGEWNQQAKLVAEDGDGGDVFGEAVDLAGDTALVGSSYDNNPTTSSSGSTTLPPPDGTPTSTSSDENPIRENAGAAYVFERTGEGWSQQAKLLAEDGDSGDRLGWAVGLAGDTALVGAVGDVDNGENAGAAYVFERRGAEWNQQAKLSPEDGRSGDLFSFSAALADDGKTALVAARIDENSNGDDAGAAYVFERVRGEWTQQTKLLPDDGDRGDKFGTAVALAGNTALVGAYDDNVNGEKSGSAYAFRRSGGTWAQQAKLLADDGDSDDILGSQVALAGDTALVGAKHDEDPNGEEAGSAYVFERLEGSGDNDTSDPSGLGGTENGSSSDNQDGSDSGGQGMPGFGLGTGLAALSGGALWHQLRDTDDEGE